MWTCATPEPDPCDRRLPALGAPAARLVRILAVVSFHARSVSARAGFAQKEPRQNRAKENRARLPVERRTWRGWSRDGCY